MAKYKCDRYSVDKPFWHTKKMGLCWIFLYNLNMLSICHFCPLWKKGPDLSSLSWSSLWSHKQNLQMYSPLKLSAKPQNGYQDCLQIHKYSTFHVFTSNENSFLFQDTNIFKKLFQNCFIYKHSYIIIFAKNSVLMTKWTLI